MTDTTTTDPQAEAGAKSARKTVQIFRAGEHVSVTGHRFTFSEADVAEIAATYDPAQHEAPVVIGHPTLDAPAYGWVAGLQAKDDALFAEIELTPLFAEAVSDGYFRKVSAAFYTRDQVGNPTPGQLHLRHLGFLGAKPPAIKGLERAQFAEAVFSEKVDPAQLVVVEMAFGEEAGRDAEDISFISRKLSDIAGMFQSLRTYLVETEGEETAEKALPGWEINWLTESSAQLTGRSDERARMARGDQADEARPYYSETEKPEEAPVNPDKTQPAGKDLAAREKELADKEAAFAERERAANEAADLAFAEKLVDEGRLPAAQKDNLVAILGSLSRDADGDAAVAFAEIDDKGKTKTVTKSPHAAFGEMVAAAPQLVSFGEVGGGEPPVTPSNGVMNMPNGYQADPEAMETHEKALAYAEQHEVDYLVAVERVQQKG